MKTKTKTKTKKTSLRQFCLAHGLDPEDSETGFTCFRLDKMFLTKTQKCGADQIYIFTDGAIECGILSTEDGVFSIGYGPISVVWQ